MSISDVLFEYDRIRRQNEIELERRRHQVYAQLPALKNLHQQIRSLQIEKIKHALNGGFDTTELTALMNEATAMLTGAGFDAHWLDPIYTCSICCDTGLRDDATRCECFKKRVLEDKLSAAHLTDSNISFEQFDLNVFNETSNKNGQLQRKQMEHYKKLAEAYAANFPDCKSLLIFTGGIGLGKTYMVKCIMRRVIERGYTAAFYTAYRLFSLFHRDRLGENVDLTPVFDVPLLIIDDIGTEPMTRNVTIEYFFDLINERNSCGLHTIIATNYSDTELKERYGEPIHSRLFDKRNSSHIVFKGDDVRR